MPQHDKTNLRARFHLFNEFVLQDQRTYYQRTLKRFQASATQVTRYRAMFAFLTGLSSAAAGYIIQTHFIAGGQCSSEAISPAQQCQSLQSVVSILVVGSVVLPALGVFFSTLADVYQWERFVPVFEKALENLEVADAMSPDDEMEDLMYKVSLQAFAEGTLSVMREEAAQWEQPISTPKQLEEFIAQELERAASAPSIVPNSPPDSSGTG